MRHRWVWMVGSLAVAAAALVAGTQWSTHRSGTPADPYEDVEFQREDIELAVEATGVVEPRNRLEINPPIGGRIDEVAVEEGTQVSKGSIIAQMSSTERASLLDAARAKGPDVLRKWETAYKPTPLVAPLDGTIIARNAEPGQTVTAADAILVLSDRLIVTALVDETDIGRIRTGQRARITLDAYRDTRTDGTVRRIAFEATTQNNVTIYEVEVEPDQIPDCMKSGMTATLAFVVSEAADALTLPSDAVASEDGNSYVLVRNGPPGGTPERWRVLTGISRDGRVEILAGLDGTERVVRRTFALALSKEHGSSPLMPKPPSGKP